jgi:ribonucleotide monophosphatase NagD (HAD superfamily)
MIWCAGAIARDYAEMGGRVVMAGKPFAPIYELAYKELAAITQRAINRSRILAIGDGLPTDIAGANEQGLDSVFIASGMHGESLWSRGVADITKIHAAFSEANVRPTYAMGALR